MPVGGSDLWILAVGRAFLTALTLFEPLRLFADPNIVVIPRVPHQDFRAVHELLSVRAVETHSAAGPRNVRAVLSPLVHNHADLELGIHSRKLSSELVVVKAINVHNTVDLKLALKIKDQVKTQVLKRSGRNACVCILIVFPTQG